MSDEIVSYEQLLQSLLITNKAYKELKAENERLRDALQDIASMKYGNNTMYAVMECMNYVARQALGEK